MLGTVDDVNVIRVLGREGSGKLVERFNKETKVLRRQSGM